MVLLKFDELKYTIFCLDPTDCHQFRNIFGTFPNSNVYLEKLINALDRAFHQL